MEAKFFKLVFIRFKALAIQEFQPSVVKQNPFSYQKQTEIIGDFYVLIVVVNFEVPVFLRLYFVILKIYMDYIFEKQFQNGPYILQRQNCSLTQYESCLRID